MRGTAIAAGAALVAGALLARSVAVRVRSVRRVPAELRRPMLLAPLTPGNPLLLPLMRTPVAPGPLRDDVRLERLDVPDAPQGGLVVFRPERATGGALLWIHGGGYVLGTASADQDWCARLASEAGVVVASAEYRLAPEQPFPAALDDCMAALRLLHERAGGYGVDPARIAVGGASAGGGLAAAVVQRAHDEGIPVAFQLLEYPMLDDRTVLRVDTGGRGELVWTPGANRFGWTSYLGFAPGQRTPPLYAAPARRADLGGLPPAWIGVGDLDLFLEEDREYARRLEAAGVPCELVVEPRMYHGADVIAAAAPSMQAFRARMVDAVRAAVGAP